MNHPLNEWLSEVVSAEEMDIAADILVGGPMNGFISDSTSVVSSLKILLRYACIISRSWPLIVR